jgi:hypothetical protein
MRLRILRYSILLCVDEGGMAISFRLTDALEAWIPL